MNNRSLLLASILLIGAGSSMFARVTPQESRSARAGYDRVGDMRGPRFRKMRRAARRHQRMTPTELMESRKKRMVILDKLKNALDKANVAKDDNAYEWVEKSRERVRRRLEGGPRRGFFGRRRPSERRDAPARRDAERKADAKTETKKDEPVTSKIARYLGMKS